MAGLILTAPNVFAEDENEETPPPPPPLIDIPIDFPDNELEFVL
jgi:hypothetical protein